MRAIKFFKIIPHFSFFLWVYSAIGQESIDFQKLEQWQESYREKIFTTYDGECFAYGVRVTENGQRAQRSIIRSSERQHVILGFDINNALGFTGGGKFFIYPDTAKQTTFHSLEISSGKRSDFISANKPFLLKSSFGDRILTLNDGELTLLNPSDGKRKVLSKTVSAFKMSGDGHKLLAILKSVDGTEKLEIIDLKNEKNDEVLQGGKYETFVWSDDGYQLAFMERQSASNIIWLYDVRLKKNRKVLSDEKIRKNNGRIILSLGNFKANGKSIEVTLQDFPKTQKERELPAKVSIWSYFDERLHAAKPNSPQAMVQTRLALLLIGQNKLIELETPGEKLTNTFGDWYCLRNSSGKLSLTSAIDGHHLSLIGIPDDREVFIQGISMDGQHLLYYYKNHWFGYDIIKHAPICLTSGTNTVWHNLSPLLTDSGEYAAAEGFPIAVKGSLFRVGDQYDRWLLDASGKQEPICLTNGYGKNNRIELKEIQIRETGGYRARLGEKLLLTGLGELDRKRGFFTCSESNASGTEKILYTDAKFGDLLLSEDGKRFFFTRETPSDAPNWYSTVDFKEIMQLTDIQPWYEGLKTTILVGKVVNEKEVRATLYTPRQFDSTKKYPVILNYYEERTAENNDFLKPDFVQHNIDIPWFLSKGYLVLTPDIYYRQGYTGKSALDCINAAVDELIKLSYVDSSKIGIQGHSFGGFETFYIAAHSNRFKAAMASAGLSNLITLANALPLNVSMSHNQNHLGDGGQMRMGVTYWERPDLYIANSPVLEADKVKAPLLIMHNKADGNVHYEQGMEFFLSMRRLGKPCWLLEYDGEHHAIRGTANKKDYTMRMTQFFDHYLKGAAAPLWMVEGMRFKDPNYTPGYELDKLGRTPGPGINNSVEQVKIDAYSKIPIIDKLKGLNH